MRTTFNLGFQMLPIKPCYDIPKSRVDAHTCYLMDQPWASKLLECSAPAHPNILECESKGSKVWDTTWPLSRDMMLNFVGGTINEIVTYIHWEWLGKHEPEDMYVLVDLNTALNIVFDIDRAVVTFTFQMPEYRVLRLSQLLYEGLHL